MFDIGREILDSFGRVRISNPKTIFDATCLYDKQPFLFNDVITGGATSTHNLFDSCVEMSVSNIGDRVVRQSLVYPPYQPSKSLLCFFTMVLHENDSDTICRVGLFDDENDKTSGDTGFGDGVFIEIGVGDIACGFVFDRKLYYTNIFKNNNKFDSVYIKRAALPVRYEIESFGGSDTLRQICSSVISEGGYSQRGKTFPTKNSIVPKCTCRILSWG